jgi:hypothetical protein
MISEIRVTGAFLALPRVVPETRRPDAPANLQHAKTFKINAYRHNMPPEPNRKNDLPRPVV